MRFNIQYREEIKRLSFIKDLRYDLSLLRVVNERSADVFDAGKHLQYNINVGPFGRMGKF